MTTISYSKSPLRSKLKEKVRNNVSPTNPKVNVSSFLKKRESTSGNNTIYKRPSKESYMGEMDYQRQIIIQDRK